MNGKITAFFILILTVFVCLSFLSCSDVDYKDGRDREEDDDDDSRRNRDFTVPPRPDFSDQDCTEYQSNVPSFRFASDLISRILTGKAKNNPFRMAEACLLKYIDQSLGPLCEEEQLLKKELEEYRNEPEIVDEIERDLENIEDIKYEYADILYEFAEEIDVVVDEEVVIEDPRNGLERIGNILVTREARSYADVIAFRTRRLCGSTLRRQTRRR